jgi:hypothetical protein
MIVLPPRFFCPKFIVRFIRLARNLRLKVKYFRAKLSSSRSLSTNQIVGREVREVASLLYNQYRQGWRPLSYWRLHMIWKKMIFCHTHEEEQGINFAVELLNLANLDNLDDASEPSWHLTYLIVVNLTNVRMIFKTPKTNMSEEWTRGLQTIFLASHTKG